MNLENYNKKQLQICEKKTEKFRSYNHGNLKNKRTNLTDEILILKKQKQQENNNQEFRRYKC